MSSAYDMRGMRGIGGVFGLGSGERIVFGLYQSCGNKGSLGSCSVGGGLCSGLGRMVLRVCVL